ncbi:dTDP-4-dehydrorhamnose reductase [Kibdelosporangium banguiense]|uniref:dTDP-4-dehydrorhamnose reductase n=1 Tax=Kibdelosporangium banguiense TaxID=1365924 RepID=A0ABS4TEI7_9PSEU|nr:dTDP-4-dehydrorhamnose reductase [Kibdelosporangium banguiense]MBP2322831.1 dTDP-4-dehydrorhamnose reductase [Kibdelosporangium banguiense]
MTALALLVPGGNGQLGHDLVAAAPEGSVVRAPGSNDLDVTQAGSVVRAVDDLVAAAAEAGLPAIVVNAAAYTAVDVAESAQAKAFAVNADGPRLLAAVCSSRQVPLVHVSTDYVFPGDKAGPYEVDDPVGPKSVYGMTKLAGEASVLRSGADAWVVRTAWVYGAGGSNFVKAITKLEGERATLSVVDDQRGSPTWSADLASGLLELAGRIVAGNGPEGRTLHCTGGGETTWYGFARAIFEELGADPDRVKPCTTAEFPRPAKRPENSVLSPASWVDAGLTVLRPWRDALAKAFPSFQEDARR